MPVILRLVPSKEDNLISSHQILVFLRKIEKNLVVTTYIIEESIVGSLIFLNSVAFRSRQFLFVVMLEVGAEAGYGRSA